MKTRFTFKSILAALICSSLLVSSFAGCTQAEAKLESTVSTSSLAETETAEVEEPIIRTLFSQPLKTEYQKAFDTYNTVDSILQKMKDTYTAATDKENVVVVPVIGDETLQDELKATEEAAESLGKKVPRDNDERYIMWREGAEESLLEQAQAAYDEWLAEQKAAEAAKKAEEEAKAKAEAEAKAKAEAEAAAQQQQPSGGGSSTTGGGGSSSGGSTGGNSNNYVPPAPAPDPEPEYTPPQPAPEPPAPAPEPPAPQPDNGGGGAPDWSVGLDGEIGVNDGDVGDAIIYG